MKKKTQRELDGLALPHASSPIAEWDDSSGKVESDAIMHTTESAADLNVDQPYLNTAKPSVLSSCCHPGGVGTATAIRATSNKSLSVSMSMPKYSAMSRTYIKCGIRLIFA
ncbi:MAG: hypothetical protein FRX49_09230 [Trebouxia sp. A1-2]|nr:MAG: hypothetical protein FRX49_09230 [Trebouxia sp. A1-2]